MKKLVLSIIAMSLCLGTIWFVDQVHVFDAAGDSYRAVQGWNAEMATKVWYEETTGKRWQGPTWTPAIPVWDTMTPSVTPIVTSPTPTQQLPQTTPTPKRTVGIIPYQTPTPYVPWPQPGQHNG